MRSIRELIKELRNALPTDSRRDLQPGWSTVLSDLEREVLDSLARGTLRPAPKCVSIRREPGGGGIQIMEDEVVLAHTKSLSVARRIRDALNSRDALVGQVVRLQAPGVGRDSDGILRQQGTRTVTGVVMAVSPTFDALLRLPDNRLEEHSLVGAEILDEGEAVHA